MSFAPYLFHTHVPLSLARHTGRSPRGSAWCTKSIGALQEERTQARSEGHTGECCEAEIQIVGQEALPVAQPWARPGACTEYGVPVTVWHHRITIRALTDKSNVAQLTSPAKLCGMFGGLHNLFFLVSPDLTHSTYLRTILSEAMHNIRRVAGLAFPFTCAAWAGKRCGCCHHQRL
jgi:hypothetical protein